MCVLNDYIETIGEKCRKEVERNITWLQADDFKLISNNNRYYCDGLINIITPRIRLNTKHREIWVGRWSLHIEHNMDFDVFAFPCEQKYDGRIAHIDDCGLCCLGSIKRRFNKFIKVGKLYPAAYLLTEFLRRGLNTKETEYCQKCNKLLGGCLCP